MAFFQIHFAKTGWIACRRRNLPSEYSDFIFCPAMARRNQSLLEDVLHGAVTMLAGIIRCLSRLRAGVFRRRPCAWPAETAVAPEVDALERMSGQQFVGLVAAAFRQEGYLVVERGGRRPDGGIDLEMYLGRDRYLVRCQQWRATRVGLEVVRELFGAMRAERAVGCFIVTSGSFADDARAFATGRAIRLVPAESLRRMMAGQGGRDEASAASAFGGDLSPACPHCGKAMVSRLAGRGEVSGLSFWGCSGFPLCRGVRAK
jgi:restriction system protein